MAVLVTGLGMASPAAHALEPGDWFARVGASYVDPDSEIAEVPGFPGSGLEVDTATQFTFTLGYMVTSHIAVELLGALPFEHDIHATGSIAGLGKVAKTKHLPPVLSLQYHFAPQAAFRPYVGVGVNYTTFFEEKSTGELDGMGLSLKDSWGPAAQIGADLTLGGDWFINADVRYIAIDTRARIEGVGNVDVDINPWVYSLAIGRSF